MRCVSAEGTVVGVELIPGLPERDATSYYPPRWRLLVLALGCLACGAFMLVPTLSEVAFVAGIGWAGVVLFGLAAVPLVLRALRPGPTVTIDAEGITDRTTLATTGLVRWEQITVIRKKEIGRGMGAERLLEVVLNDPDGFRDRPRSWVRRVADGYRAVLRQAAVTIPGSMVSVDMATVMAEIRRRRPGLQVLEGPPPLPPKLPRLRRTDSRGPKRPDLPRW
jgi:hypothetical protein